MLVNKVYYKLNVSEPIDFNLIKQKKTKEKIYLVWLTDFKEEKVANFKLTAEMNMHK